MRMSFYQTAKGDSYILFDTNDDILFWFTSITKKESRNDISFLNKTLFRKFQQSFYPKDSQTTSSGITRLGKYILSLDKNEPYKRQVCCINKLKISSHANTT